MIDSLPIDVTFVSASANCSQYGRSIICELGDIVNGAQKTVRIVVTPMVPGELINTAAATSSVVDPEPGNNMGLKSSNVIEAADLVMELASSPNPVVGGEVVYTIVVTNLGPSNATTVKAVGALPATADMLSASASCSRDERTVTCELGDIPVGGQEIVQIVVATKTAGELVNTMTVVSDAFDPDLRNNAGRTNSTVMAAADLSVEFGRTDSPEVGGELNLLLTVTNSGPSTARSVVLINTISDEAIFVSASASCSIDGRTVRCQLGDLSRGTTRMVRMTVTPSAVGELVSTAVASSSVVDRDSANNLSTYATKVTARRSDSAKQPPSKWSPRSPSTLAGKQGADTTGYVIASLLMLGAVAPIVIVFILLLFGNPGSLHSIRLPSTRRN